MAPRGSVLVVDTDQAIVDFMVEALTDEGYRAWGVSDGAGATAAILTKSPDLVLIDRYFSDMDGLDVVRAARAWGIDIPIVIMTTDLSQAENVEAQGAKACLLKPFDLDDLLVCVADHMRPTT